MRSLLPEQRHVNGYTLLEGAIADTHRAMLAQLGQEIGVRISAAAEYVLGRAPTLRRGHVPYSIEQTRACPRCRSIQSQRFSCNGSRRASRLRCRGEVPLRWPRLVCERGGASRSTWTIGCAPTSALAAMFTPRFSAGAP